jgi:hypothetical protein
MNRWHIASDPFICTLKGGHLVTFETAISLNVYARLEDLEQKLLRVAGTFAKPQQTLYALLADSYALVVEIGHDERRIELLNDALLKKGIPEALQIRARTVAAKVALWLFRDEGGDLINKSTRSLYKRALERARGEYLSTAEFHSVLEDLGVYAFANRASAPSRASCDGLAAARNDLMTKAVKAIPSIRIIANESPYDTFVVVVYRPEGTQHVPCFMTDNPSDVNAFLRIVYRDRKRQSAIPTSARDTLIASPLHADATQKAA